MHLNLCMRFCLQLNENFCLKENLLQQMFKNVGVDNQSTRLQICTAHAVWAFFTAANIVTRFFQQDRHFQCVC